MNSDSELIAFLQEAISASPDNLPLRRRLAEVFLSHGNGIEGERQFRAALRLLPGDPALSLGLARCFHLQGKKSQALALLESLEGAGKASPEAQNLMAQLLLDEGRNTTARQLFPQNEVSHEDPIDQSKEETGGWEGSHRERPKISFQQVGGMGAVKKQIRMKVLLPLEKPELFKAYGKRVGGGLLLYGPPGCGKTYMARAVAGEVNAKFFSVAIHQILSKWHGESEERLNQFFEQARRLTPAVLFFDEVDALGARRSDMQGAAGRSLINQFLAELDGLDDNNDGLLILAATNSPWHLDPAFRRPGRFDRMIFVPPPDLEAREAILRIQCQGKPQDKLDFAKLAKRSKEYSGADLMAVVDQAVDLKLEQALESGAPQPLVTRDLLKALAAVRPTTGEWFASAKNYALYSNEGGQYDDILQFLGLS
ncbi:MAG: AAA family ATPase [Planctomycetota bacterium]|nr:MAG: AAA family ATPase [Planctomycetota bacterium]